MFWDASALLPLLVTEPPPVQPLPVLLCRFEPDARPRTE